MSLVAVNAAIDAYRDRLAVIARGDTLHGLADARFDLLEAIRAHAAELVAAETLACTEAARSQAPRRRRGHHRRVQARAEAGCS